MYVFVLLYIRISLFPSLLLSFFFHSKFETLCVANCKQNSRKNSKVIWCVAVLCCIVVWCDAWRVDFVEIWTHFIATIFLVRFLDDVVVVIIWSKQFSALRSCCSLFFYLFLKKLYLSPLQTIRFDLLTSCAEIHHQLSTLTAPTPPRSFSTSPSQLGKWIENMNIKLTMMPTDWKMGALQIE